MSDAPVAETGVDVPGPPLAPCPFCEQPVPLAPYCGSCGAHLQHPHERARPGRAHAFVASPDETVLHLALVTSLFPHLSHRARGPFRAALAVVVVALVAWALAGQQTAMIATAAFGLPVVFFLYLVEVDPYETTFVRPTVAAFVIGAALGVGWALIGGPVVTDALRPSFTASLTSGTSLKAAILVPLVAQVLMCAPAVVIRMAMRPPFESLDGFAAGATGALGLTVSGTLIELAPQLHASQTFSPGVTGSLTEAVVRGVSVPLVAALATGFFGAALWSTTGDRSSARARWAASPLPAFALAALLQVGLGFADIARLTDDALIVVHLAAVVVLIVAMRAGLHYVLLHERHDVTVGRPRTCSHCHHVVPAMPFCPHCGVASRATPRRHRLQPLEWSPAPAAAGSGSPTGDTVGDAGSDSGGGGGPEVAPGPEEGGRS